MSSLKVEWGRVGPGRGRAGGGGTNKFKRENEYWRTRNLCHKDGSVSLRTALKSRVPFPPNARVLQYDWQRLGIQYEDSYGT